jgi:hypothetical protein
MAGITFPFTAHYRVAFRFSDTGLAGAGLVFSYMKLVSDGSAVPFPNFTEIGGGVYAFDHVWNAATDSDIDFLADGGPSIPTQEVRYVPGTISIREFMTASSGGGGGGGGGGSVG